MKKAVLGLASLVIAVAVVVLSIKDSAAMADKWPTTRQPPARFAKVNGVRLHYLDWGGRGEPLLFLTGLGGTAEDFQALAVRLTDCFHVYGLTRLSPDWSSTRVLHETLRADCSFAKLTPVLTCSIIGEETANIAYGFPAPAPCFR